MALGITLGAISTVSMGALYSKQSALLVNSVLMSHEGGHYYSALSREGDPDPPYIIPLGIGAIGITRVRRLQQFSKRSKRRIIAAGPVAGVIASIAMLPFTIIFLSKSALYVLMGITAVEIYNGIFGSDGKKLRTQKES